MTLPKKLISIRSIALFLCLLTVGAYSAFLPPPVFAGGGGDIVPFELPEGADGCYYGGQLYSLGAKLSNGQVCRVNNGVYYWD